MPVPTETLWNIRKVSIVFACSSVAMLASIIWLVKVDYARPWRTIQNDFVDLQASLAHFDVLGLHTHESLEQLAQAQHVLSEAQRTLDEQQAATAELVAAIRQRNQEVDTSTSRNQTSGSLTVRQASHEVEADRRFDYSTIEQVLTLIESDPAVYVRRARVLDPAFAEAVQGQVDAPDAAALAERLATDEVFAGRLAELLEWFNLEKLEEQARSIRGDHARADLRLKGLRADLEVALAAYEYQRGLHGELDRRTSSEEARYQALAAETEEARLAYEQLADEAADIEAQQRRLRAEVTEAERALARIQTDRDEIIRRHEALANTVHRGIFNLPLLDFAAPKGTPGRNEIRQVVLPDVRVELNFVQNYATDRCMTCHVAIDDRNFTKENLARRLERAVLAANEELLGKGEAPLTPPVVPGREDLAAGEVGNSWQTLTTDQQDGFFDEVVRQINRYQARRGSPPLKFGQPLLAHPNLDLYVSANSPHPMSQVGCTVCHEGSGEETDFVFAAHTPKTPQEREEWEKKYYVRTAGLLPEVDFKTAEHHWNRPMLPPQYSEAGCTKCHSKVSDVAMYNHEPAARRINEGRLLFQQLGCINCHLVEDMAGARQVGPDLSHVGEKLTRGFMHNWIWFPNEYRPSTTMPHYFLQENNDAGSETTGGDTDPILRTRAEVVAMTEYLLQASTGYSREPLPEDLWEPLKDPDAEATLAAAERGRKVFGSVGCLACHATLSHPLDDVETGEAGETIGSQWIAGDLAAKLEELAAAVQLGQARKLKQRMLEAAAADGHDPQQVSVTGDESVLEALEMDAEGDGPGISLPVLIEHFLAAFDGPRYDPVAARNKAFREMLRIEPGALAGIEISEDEQEALYVSDDAYFAMLDFAEERYESMTYVERVEYSMVNFRSAYDTIFDPRSIDGPVFTRFAPELSSIGTKFENYEQAVTWLYDWLKDPRHYSEYTLMPRMRLRRHTIELQDPETLQPTGETVEADEALDVAVYLSTLQENREFSTEPFDADERDRTALAGKRDELIITLLSGLNSRARSQAILDDEGGELTEQLIAKLSDSLGAEDARSRILGLDLEQRRWMFLGDRMIGHYGCYACHQVAGYETSPPPGTELTRWGEKQLDQLDFAFFKPKFRKLREHDPLFHHLYPHDREDLIRWIDSNPPEQVEHTLASFASYKLRNPRIWDRKKAKGPYDKLKMPNFFLDDEQTEALATYLLSRKPPLVNRSLQVNYEGTPAGKIADGRNLARELNCIACHRIDGNAAVIDQYFMREDPAGLVFDETNAPPWLRGQGAKVQSAWLYRFLNDVEVLRPWLQVRMPSYHLTRDESRQLVEYFFGLSQDESSWLARQLDPVHKYIEDAHRGLDATFLAGGRSPPGQGDDPDARRDAERPGADWYRQENLTGQAHVLRRYAGDNRLVAARTLDPTQTDPETFAEAHAQIVHHAEFLRDLYDVDYPFTESPVTGLTPEKLADGETIFMELRCMACHVFGDPGFPGANPAPTAPNLQLTSDRLRRDWVVKWLEAPGRIQPGTMMPTVFGENQESAFADYPPEARESLLERLINKDLIDDGRGQIAALTAFLYDAGAKRLDKVQPPDPILDGGEAVEDSAAEEEDDEGGEGEPEGGPNGSATRLGTPDSLSTTDEEGT